MYASMESSELEQDKQTARRPTLFSCAQDEIGLRMYFDDWKKQIGRNSEWNNMRMVERLSCSPLTKFCLIQNGSIKNKVI